MNQHNLLAREIVDTSYKLHTRLGPGLLESVYEAVLSHELTKRGLKIERQPPVPIVYDGIKFDEGFRADIVVENMIILELKSVEKVNRSHKKQLLTYLKLTGMRLGLLINFGEAWIKDGIYRVVNRL
ncbi:MAG: GxxExxY protein [bacterium]|nr:MAG: GxxExxY protein [bacterium]